MLHWGQRKLLMSEIEFLTLHATPGCVVVYAGAAPGLHCAFLSDMFPEVRQFILVDPSPFSVRNGCRTRAGFVLQSLSLCCVPD